MSISGSTALRGTGVIAFLLLGVTACGTTTPAGSSAPAATPASGAAQPSSVTPSDVTPSSGATIADPQQPEADVPATLPDGSWYGYITVLESGGFENGGTMTFDLIELYRGSDAQTKWDEDPKGAFGGESPNQHLVINEDPKTRKLKIADQTPIYVYSNKNSPKPGKVNYKQFTEYFGSPFLDERRPYQVTIADGNVTKIEELNFS